MQIVEWARGADATVLIYIGDNPVSLRFTKQDRYCGHRARAISDPVAAASLLSQGHVAYTGPIIATIPEDATDFNWQDALAAVKASAPADEWETFIARELAEAVNEESADEPKRRGRPRKA